MAAFATAARAERHDAAISGDSGRADVTRESLNAKGLRSTRRESPPGVCHVSSTWLFRGSGNKMVSKKIGESFLE